MNFPIISPLSLIKLLAVLHKSDVRIASMLSYLEFSERFKKFITLEVTLLPIMLFIEFSFVNFCRSTQHIRTQTF